MLKDPFFWVDVYNEMKNTLPMKWNISFAIIKWDVGQVEIMDIEKSTPIPTHHYSFWSRVTKK
jgi:hypothetical protein